MSIIVVQLLSSQAWLQISEQDFLFAKLKSQDFSSVQWSTLIGHHGNPMVQDTYCVAAILLNVIWLLYVIPCLSHFLPASHSTLSDSDKYHPQRKTHSLDISSIRCDCIITAKYMAIMTKKHLRKIKIFKWFPQWFKCHSGVIMTF